MRKFCENYINLREKYWEILRHARERKCTLCKRAPYIGAREQRESGVTRNHSTVPSTLLTF
jgi:hypothetical protein